MNVAGMTFPRRALLVAVSLTVVAAGCGSRTTETQQLQARGVASGTAARATTGGFGAGGGADPSGGASDGGTVTGAGGSLSDGAEGTTGAPGGGAAPGAGTTGGGIGAPAPSGGNGGATDVGVTGDTITLGHVSTLSGPIPGLFQGAVIGAQAFVGYVNSQGGVYGRKLKLETRDDQFDSGQHGAQTADLAKKVVAFLGSFSTYDDTGVGAIARENVPDVGYGLTDGRRNARQNFSPQPAKSGVFRTGAFEHYAKKYPDAVKAVGTIYGDVPASKASALDANHAARSAGWRFAYERAYQPTETDFTADVVRMRQEGVKAVYVVAADVRTVARLLKAMQQQSFRPEFTALGANGYDATLVPLAGSAAEGVLIDQQLALYQGGDAAGVPEVALMNQWIQRVKPGYTPDLFAAYSWASGRLLLQALQSAGPRLTRRGLLDALAKIDQFDANGLVAPAGPASKRAPLCNMYVRIQGGRFVRVEPPGKGYLCGGRLVQRR